jgi:hypothetical protein
MILTRAQSLGQVPRLAQVTADRIRLSTRRAEAQRCSVQGRVDGMEFIYGWDPDSKTFEIVTQQGVDSLDARRGCKTWGEWADLCGLS